MKDALTLIRHADRPTVAFVGGATYQPIIGDDTGEGMPIRTGIQTSPPGYATQLHSHPYVELLTVLEGTGEAWLDGEDGVVVMGRAARDFRHPHVGQAHRQLQDSAGQRQLTLIVTSK
jgi:quercetin dioxygenase-like cupin family protein